MIAQTAQSQELSTLQTARRMLGEARSLDEIKSIHDKAEAVRQYAKSAHLGLQAQNHAAEIRLLAERRAGELLSRMRLRGGGRWRAHVPRGTRLKELGVSRKQSMRWQREASFPEAVFQRYLHETASRGEELTSSGLLVAGARWERSARPPKQGDAVVSQLAATLRIMAGQGRTFGSIYASPPWMGNRARNHGIGTPFSKFADTLSRLPVKDVAAPKAHLHLWTVADAVSDAFRVMRAWGFRYASMLVWTRTLGAYGEYWRNACDVLVLGVRGCFPLRDNAPPDWIDGRKASPLDKCRQIRQLVERVSPAPYLDLFGESPAEGWTLVST